MANNIMAGVKVGTTNLSLPVVLRKSTDNTELTGIAAAGVTASYVRQGAARVAITVSALAAADSAYSSGGWFEISLANTPGLYRLDVPNAAFVAGADWVVISVQAAGAYVFYERYALTVDDNQKSSVAVNLPVTPPSGYGGSGGGSGVDTSGIDIDDLPSQSKANVDKIRVQPQR